MANYQFIAIGTVTVDIFLASKEFRLLARQTSGWGKVALCTLYGEKIEIRQRQLAIGGGGANSAVGLSRLGFKTALLAACGDDCFGKEIKTRLAKVKRLDAHWLQVRRGAVSDQAVILLGPNGERTILVARLAPPLRAGEINWSRFKGDNFYLSSLGGNLELAAKIIHQGQKLAARVFWNPGKLELQSREKVLSLAKNTILMLNQDEAEKLFAASGQALRRKIMAAKIPLVAVTQGAGGATLLRGRQVWYQPALLVPVVDTTGAGDAFGVGLAAALARGEKPLTALSWGLANAAAVVQAVGAQTGLLKEKQLKQILRRYGRE